MYKLKGWTETVRGYLNEADLLSRCIYLNREYMKKDYAYACSINIEIEMTACEIKSLWTKTCRKLRKHNVIALWVREPSKTNHCDYHLIIQGPINHAELEDAIENAMPPRSIIPWHKQIKKVMSQYHWSRYMTKAKTSGFLNGKMIEDKYKSKRRLFVPHLGLRKYGTIGKFWTKGKTKASLWQEIIDVEARIGEGLEMHGIEQLSKHVSEFIGEPLKGVRRSYCYYANTPAVKNWVKVITAG